MVLPLDTDAEIRRLELVAEWKQAKAHQHRADAAIHQLRADRFQREATFARFRITQIQKAQP
jgi:hypothetical protein